MSTPNPSTTDWVPLWANTPGAAGNRINYLGGYVAGTYNQGDIVVWSDGTAYLCVKDGTNTPPEPWPGPAPPSGGTGIPLPVVNGRWIKGVGGAAVWSTLVQSDIPIIPYATSLPSSPFDGQVAILVDSVTNPSYQWAFRYNSSSTSSYKWEFIGGNVVVIKGGTYSTPTGPTAWLDGNGPSMNLPRPGIYEFVWGVQYGYCNTSNVASMMMTVSIPSGQLLPFYYNGSMPQPLTMSDIGTTTSAGVAKAQFQANNAIVGNFIGPWVRATPVRVS